uniref:Ig-like domain-containing protein n=1 Tax=Macrostomum lignano TaxID=282301 RepID=A0A1I8FQM8_9PLAT
LEDAGLVAAGSKARHSQRSKPKLKRNEDNWCTSIEHIINRMPGPGVAKAVPLPVQSPVVQGRPGDPVRSGRHQPIPPAPSPVSPRTHLAFTRVQFYHAGNYTCRISSNEIFPPGRLPWQPAGGSHLLLPGQSLKFINLRVSPESHSAIIDSMPYYPPDEPRQLQEGRLYMSRLGEMAPRLSCTSVTTGRLIRSTAASSGAQRRGPRPRTSMPAHRVHCLGPSSIHGYSIEDRKLRSACKPEDFGLRLSKQFRLGFVSRPVTQSEAAGPAGASRGLTKKLLRVPWRPLELDSRGVTSRRLRGAGQSLRAAQLDAFGEIVKYNKVDHLVAYWYAGGAGVQRQQDGIVTRGHHETSRVKLVMEQRWTADQDGYYICAAEAKAFEDLRSNIFISTRGFETEALWLAPPQLRSRSACVCVDNTKPCTVTARRRRPAPAARTTRPPARASTVTASDTAPTLLVPEVRVERIGASRSMVGASDPERLGRDDEGCRSTSTNNQ